MQKTAAAVLVVKHVSSGIVSHLNEKETLTVDDCCGHVCTGVLVW
jgi:hypothetical protein